MVQGRNLELFSRLLTEATAAVAPEYFLLPVASDNSEEPLEQYRERVYAYELYHQLRSRWPADWPYSLAGEIDKNGHPIIRGGYLDNAKPDLLVHVPGDMGYNLVVIEIKPIRPHPLPGERAVFERDLHKLLAFREIGYEAAFLLVFGESADRVIDYGEGVRQAGLRLDLVALWHHRRPRESACLVEW